MAIATLAAIYIVTFRPFVAQMGATIMSPLSARKSGVILDDAQRLLAFVPLSSDRADDSLRFVAMPSFGKRWMAVSLARNGTNALGRVAVLDRSTGIVSTRKFQMNGADFDEMMAQWDNETSGYWGELSMWTDGTPLGFERRIGKYVVSGIGNSPCHYDGLGNLAALYIGPHVAEMRDLQAPDFEKIRRSNAC
ncbi:hypothetical protein [Novosphingobium resinovorum]|uniref:hypothetical protein n=1 Tax=Novosphingobium resinovorum TaxID=158500 RepID=UPI002ED0BA19|nr:hypothetical protein [Novosphingobium resinovorum]